VGRSIKNTTFSAKGIKPTFVLGQAG
jgi:hypothetical protein